MSGSISRRELELIVTAAREAGAEGDWDVLLVGDGSGDGWTNACGWAVTLIDRHTRTRRVFAGAMSAGTSAIAELMPYLQAMLWHVRFRGDNLRARLERPIRVGVVTDLKDLADTGNDLEARLADPRRLRTTRCLWAAVDQLRKDGYEFKFCWSRRNTLQLNRAMHTLALKAFRSFTVTREESGSDEKETDPD